MHKGTERILEAIEKLDLSPTMHQDATNKYITVCEFLGAHGIEAEFYPQGSFSLGTVVRPFSKGEELTYDLDVVCQVNNAKDQITPKELKHSVGDALKGSETYRTRLAEEDQICWTIEYVGVSDLNFSLDIVPSVGRDTQEISRLILGGLEGTLANTAISITKKISSNLYDWFSSNPKGLAEWFNRKNRPFFVFVANQQKELFFTSAANTYCTIEDVPDFVVKTNLQRSIQFLKRHRDIYFFRKSSEDNKPSSIVITVLMGLFSDRVNPSISLLELISDFAEATLQHRPITSSDPMLENPAEPGDNLLVDWNSEKVNCFYSWLKSLQQDLLVINKDGVEAIKSVDSILFTENLGLASQVEIPKTKNVDIPTKPWRN